MGVKTIVDWECKICKHRFQATADWDSYGVLPIGKGDFIKIGNTYFCVYCLENHIKNYVGVVERTENHLKKYVGVVKRVEKRSITAAAFQEAEEKWWKDV